MDPGREPQSGVGDDSSYDPSQGAQHQEPSDRTDTTADPSSGIKPHSTHQGSERPHDEPNNEESDAIKSETKQTEKEQSGDGDGEGDDMDDSGSGGSGGGAPPPMPGAAGDGPKPETESHGEGTGQQYVKSSGVAAEGGDFDAANPGAGREADRLLGGDATDRGDDSASQANKKTDDDLGDKPSKLGFTDKIKEKLHKN